MTTDDNRFAYLKFTRRRLLALGAGAALLVACGSDDDDDGAETGSASGASGATTTKASTGSQTTASAGQTTPAASAFPATIEHKFGATEIRAAPERVLSLGYMEHDALLALGVKPIATRYWFSDEPYAVLQWARDELGDAKPEVLNMPFGELDYEKIIALQPDLISAVYAGLTAQEYERLSEIAPTISQSGDYIDFGMPWQEGTVVIGKAVGKEAEAVALVDALQGRFDEAKVAHPNWAGKTVAVVSPGRDAGAAIFGSGDLRSRVFTDLGFVVPPEFDEITGESFYAEVSMERSDLFDQDLVIVHQLSYYEGGAEALKADPLWSRLKAFQEDRALFLEVDIDYAYGFNSVLSMDYFLDAVLPRVAAAMDGDPATVANG